MNLNKIIDGNVLQELIKNIDKDYTKKNNMPDMSRYAKATDIPSLDNYVQKKDLNVKADKSDLATINDKLEEKVDKTSLATLERGLSGDIGKLKRKIEPLLKKVDNPINGVVQNIGRVNIYNEYVSQYCCLGDPFGGLMFQFGSYYSDTYGKETKDINFPVAFPHACFIVLKTACGQKAAVTNKIYYQEWSVLEVTRYRFTVNPCSPSTDVYYLAIGY